MIVRKKANEKGVGHMWNFRNKALAPQEKYRACALLCAAPLSQISRLHYLLGVDCGVQTTFAVALSNVRRCISHLSGAAPTDSSKIRINISLATDALVSLMPDLSIIPPPVQNGITSGA